MNACLWTFQQEGYYDTACGHAWAFETGDIEDNGIKFCPYCGKPLKESHE